MQVLVLLAQPPITHLSLSLLTPSSMGKIYTTLQLADLFRRATEQGQLSEADLCERAAMAFVRTFAQLYRHTPLIHIFAGPGTNGAYALAIARRLHEARRQVSIYLFYHQGQLSEECRAQRHRLDEAIPITEVTTRFDPPEFLPRQVIIDGIFGSEYGQPLSGGFLGLVQLINRSKLDVVSIDLPTGLYADDNTTTDYSAVVKATHTLTLEVPRLALLMQENAPYTGQWQILPLGIDASVHQAIASDYYAVEELLLARTLRRRERFSSKGDYGQALIIGGDKGRCGALVLATQAALRSGCGGIDTLATAPEASTILALATPEVVVRTEDLRELPLDAYSAIALGTGIQPTAHHADQIRHLCQSYSRPLVLDGRAIDLLIQDRTLIGGLPSSAILLVEKEQRPGLLGYCHTDWEYLEKARELAREQGVTLILKGAYTAVCRRSGSIFFSTSGNAGMASSGVGDVLSGLLVGLLARGYEPLTASLLACYLHGTAADQCVARSSEETLSASQIISELPCVLSQLYAEE